MVLLRTSLLTVISTVFIIIIIIKEKINIKQALKNFYFENRYSVYLILKRIIIAGFTYYL